MIVQNKKTKAEYPISKADFEGMPEGIRKAFKIISDTDTKETLQTTKAIPLVKKVAGKVQTVEPSTGEKKSSRKKKDEDK